MQLCEERVFNVGRAPLFLAVMPSRLSSHHSQQSHDDDEDEEDEDEEDEEDEEEDDDEDSDLREEVEEDEEEKPDRAEQEDKDFQEAVKGTRDGTAAVVPQSIRSDREEQRPFAVNRTTKVTWRR